jgi:hypothetical protein
LSSLYVRDTITDFLESNQSETVVDLTAEFRDLREVLGVRGVGRDTGWLGIQFFGNPEEPITVPAQNSQGKFREDGVIYIHVVAVAKLGAGRDILLRAEALRTLFRSRNIGGIRIETVSPPNYDASNTLQFEGGWTSASVLVSYEYDIDL